MVRIRAWTDLLHVTTLSIFQVIRVIGYRVNEETAGFIYRNLANISSHPVIQNLELVYYQRVVRNLNYSSFSHLSTELYSRIIDQELLKRPATSLFVDEDRLHTSERRFWKPRSTPRQSSRYCKLFRPGTPYTSHNLFGMTLDKSTSCLPKGGGL